MHSADLIFGEKFDKYCDCKRPGGTTNNTADPLPEPDRIIKAVQHVFCADFNISCVDTAVLLHDDDGVF